MKRSEPTRQKPSIFTSRHGAIALLGGVAVMLSLLVATAMLFAPRLLVSPALKEKIQILVTEKTGGRLDYQAIDLCYFPRPGIELQGVSLTLPEQTQGTIAILRISPTLLPLLTGNIQLSTLDLDTPQFSLALPDAPKNIPPAQPLTLSVIEEKLARSMEAVGPMFLGLDTKVSNGQVTLMQNKQKLVSMSGMNLQGETSIPNIATAQFRLKTHIDELTVYHQNQQETIKDFNLSAGVRMAAGTMTATLDQLDFSEPRLSLSGELIFTPTEPQVTLNLSGSNIDVEASRTAALALAGDTTPIKEIFTYLRGGQVDQITFTSHGTTISELGRLDNLVIKGNVQAGRIAIPEIELELTEVAGDVVISKGILQGTGLSTRLKNSTGQDGSLQIGLTDTNDLFQLELALDGDLAEVYPWLASREGLQDQLQTLQKVSGRINMSSLKLKGRLGMPSAWDITSTGTLNNLAITTELFPETIHLASGEFTMNPQQLSFKKLKAASQDSALSLSGIVKGFPRRLDRLDLSLNGRMGTQSVTWLATQFKMPDAYMIHAPLTIGDSKISWIPDSTTSFKGSVEIDNGPVITADVDHTPDRLRIHHLTAKDQYSDATLVFDRSDDRRDFTFTGSLQHETLQTLFVDAAFKSGRLEGNLAVSLPTNVQAAVRVVGELTGDNLPLVLPTGDRVDIDHVLLQGDGGSNIKVDITEMTWEDLSWSPVKATVSFSNNSADIQFTDARLCGIESRGTISATGNAISVDMALTGKNLDAATSYSCLTKGEVKMTGSLDFSSKIKTTGQIDRLVERMQGPLQMTFHQGIIQQNKMLSRILEVLNVTEIIKGRLPNLTSNGFPYKTMTVQGRFTNGQLAIDKYHMDGETLDLLGKGEINLEKRTVDMQLLAAPFQTANTIVKQIPGVNYLLAGSLVSIPVSIHGPLRDPKVTILSASAVSSSLFNLAKRTLESPFKLLDALNPWSKEK
ncbi:AsmA family protein [Desulfopila sp. IMCC35006]|uniref:YhdP family protein n=1 Tax=Desulfopila sp. IMCC35006 TaxID=2569542 RepID=UPI0010AC4F7E|nr:AsmA-like C-terminal domain-containing protein [Desulfopila sp. IMCC35006]TKB26991.1 AsmA family protein [Desulfopila sp. IMCC35006]